MLGIKHEVCLDLPQSEKPGQQHLQLGFCLGQKRMRFRGEKRSGKPIRVYDVRERGRRSTDEKKRSVAAKSTVRNGMGKGG